MPLRIYNTLTHQHEAFRPGDPAKVTFYTCGPTVYDDAHIGNFRSFLAADVLRRWIESPLCEVEGPDGTPVKGPRRVVHVMNITDVGHMTDDAEGGEHGEDRMAIAGRRLLEYKKAGKLPPGVEVDAADPRQIAKFYTQRFLEDARTLGLKVAIEAEKDRTLMPRATESIAGMIGMIGRLIERGHAYAVGPPGKQTVYFSVTSFPNYGRLSGNTLEHLREGAGGRIAGEHQAEKKHPADFLLWKSDPSHLMKWPSPWGEGYPGWHIECSVMSYERLVAAESRSGEPGRPGPGFKPGTLPMFPNGEPIIDLHSGGEDNIFPHHESEIAQSCCALNERPDQGVYARMWFHPRFLFVEGDKMSKSKGNFFTARDLFAKGHEAGAVRMELIRTHYRSNANFTEQGLKDSARIVERWRRFTESATASPESSPASRADDARAQVRDDFAAAMHDDLNIAGAIGAINKWVSETSAPTKADAALMDEFDAVFGLLERERAATSETSIGIFAPGVDPNPVVIAKLEERRAARAAKDFKRSDAIRGELAAMGYEIKDAAGGKVEVRRKS
jgi:cysteinyl-tRNA synthetase